MKEWSNLKSYLRTLDETEKEQIRETAELIAQIIQRREDLGLTQRKLAEISGVKQSAIARLEALGVMPCLDTLYKLLKPLELTIKIYKEE